MCGNLFWWYSQRPKAQLTYELLGLLLFIFGLFNSLAQCGDIGRFFEVLGKKFTTKRCPSILGPFGLFWKIPIGKEKTIVSTCWATFDKLGLIFIPTSVHTDLGTNLFLIAYQLMFFAVRLWGNLWLTVPSMPTFSWPIKMMKLV